MTNEEITNMNLQSYNQGQRDGHNLAMNQIVDLLRSYQQHMDNFFDQEIENLK